MLSDIVSIQKERFRRSSQQNEGNLHYKQKEKSNIPDVKLQQLESYHGSVNPAQDNMTLVELFKLNVLSPLHIILLMIFTNGTYIYLARNIQN